MTQRTNAERVVIVHIQFPAGKMEEDLDEFKELVVSAGAQIVHLISGTRTVPEAKYFVGTGKAQEIADAVKLHDAQLVIFNHVLSPGQERNLEKLMQCRVIDRTGLILDIFAQRARSFEGKLQVELAVLKHLSTRLIRGWTHLERQRGGIGLRGPGETQLEVDRRLIKNRIKVITARLEKIRKQRVSGRKARRKATVPTAALVGYTNAGKSTLFNYLTNSSVYVADQLFATLDPTLRRIHFPEIGPLILADTVGFIRHLPHDLIESFQGTLEEVSEADLLLHVVDATDQHKLAHMEQVDEVLENIQAEKVPRLLIYNKADLIKERQTWVDYDEQGLPKKVWISARTGLGMPELITAIALKLERGLIEQELILKPEQAKIRAQLYQRNAIVSERIDEAGCYHLMVKLPRIEWDKLAQK